MLGRTYNIQAHTYISNDRIDSALVDIQGLKSDRIAHITISHIKGAVPAESNDLIQNQHHNFFRQLNLPISKSKKNQVMKNKKK